MFNNDTINAIKNVYANGTGTFEQVCKAAGLDYYKAGANPDKKRGTPTTTINGKVYDFHAFLKACGVEIVKHERLTAGGDRIPSQRLKVDKVNAAFDSFLARIKDITGVAPNDIDRDKIDLNSIFKVAKATAQKIDKKEEAARAAAIEAQKAARKQAKAEKALESYSIEEIEALLAKRKAAAEASK